MIRGWLCLIGGAAAALISGWCAWIGMLGFLGYPNSVLAQGLVGLTPWIALPTGAPDAWKYFNLSDALVNLRDPAAFVPVLLACGSIAVAIYGFRAVRRGATQTA